MTPEWQLAVAKAILWAAREMHSAVPVDREAAWVEASQDDRNMALFQARRAILVMQAKRFRDIDGFAAGVKAERNRIYRIAKGMQI